MNFTYENADTSKVIRKYEKNGCNYRIEYLDHSESKYLSYNENEETMLINKMIEQAKERQEMMNINDENITKYGALLLSLISSGCVAMCMENSETMLAGLAFIPMVRCVSMFRKSSAIVKELKKYKMFLEMIKDNPKPQLDISWLDLPGEERFYKIPVMNINTIDSFEYYDVKSIYKKYKCLEKTISNK